jgi:hypothetical protein
MQESNFNMGTQVHLIGPWTLTVGQDSYEFRTCTCIDPVTNFPELFFFETKQQVVWACNLKICGNLATHDHFVVSTILVLNSQALLFNKYFSVLESKTSLLAYATPNPMLFENIFISPLGMPFMSF